MNHRVLWLVPMLGFAVLGSAGCIDGRETAEGSFERTLNVTGPVELEVTTGSGNIRVRNGDASSVRVTGIIKVRDYSREDAEQKARSLESNPPIEQTGNRIRIGHIEDRGRRRNVSISYELLAPVETRLRSETGSGNQSIEGLSGSIIASTGSGGITIINIRGDVRAETGSGGIELDSVEGSVRARTGSGSIRANRNGGGFVAGTGSGDVSLEQSAPGNVEVEAASGSVEVSGVRGALRVRSGSGDISADGEPAGEWKLEASSGNITVRLAPEAAFELDARTSSGRVSSDLPLSVVGTSNPKELRGKVRGGGFPVEARTGSGNIRIR